MAVKSIIDIAVNDDQFKAFSALFEKYQEQLAKTPSAWASVNKEAKGTGDGFKAVAAALLAQNELVRKQAQAARDAAKAAKDQESSWASVAKNTKLAATNIANATLSLLKWTGLTTVLSGLLGAGGLWGIDRLAAGVAAGRAASAGIGISYGQRQAFGLNFGSRFLGNPEGTLGAISRGIFDQTSPEYRALHAQAHLPPGVVASGNAADIGAALLAQIPRLFGGKPKEQIGTWARLYGYEQLGIGVEDINRYLNASPEERRQQQEAYRKDTGALGLTPGQQRAWNDLQTQLSRAGEKIKNTFVDGLTPVTGSLGELSDAFADTIRAFLSNPHWKEWLTDANDALHRLADWMKTPEFQEAVKGFVDDVIALAKSIKSALQWLGVIPSNAPVNGPGNGVSTPGNTPPMTSNPGGGAWQGFLDWWNGRSSTPGAGAPGAPGSTATPQNTPPMAPNSSTVPGGGGTATPGNTPPMGGPRFFGGSATKSAFSALEQQYGITPGILWSLYGQESGYGKHLVSSAGALGPFQFLPSTAREVGIQNPFDTMDSARGAAVYFRRLLDMFGGDVAEAAAAYNAGPGRVRRDIARYGADWRQHLPAETQKYVGDILRRLGRGDSAPEMAHRNPPPRSAVVKIMNNTGGSAIVAGSQIAT